MLFSTLVVETGLKLVISLEHADKVKRLSIKGLQLPLHLISHIFACCQSKKVLINAYTHQYKKVLKPCP